MFSNTVFPIKDDPGITFVSIKYFDEAPKSCILLSGSSLSEKKVKYSTPEIIKGIPTNAKSNILIGSMFLSITKPLIIRFVAVPINVIPPPSIAANDNGNRSLEGEYVLLFLIGPINEATIAVLFKKPENNEAMTDILKTVCRKDFSLKKRFER